ncbi:MAG: thiamine-phosphate pyrophosphorylase [Arcobacteraceae bacterium]|jgi:thiamine-phosphate pyrophosphorylase
MTKQIKKEAYNKPPFFISYLITDPIEFGNTPLKLKESLTQVFQKHTVDMICFRDKISPNKEELARACLEIARQFKINRILINTDIELYHSLGFDGIHLNSEQFDEIENLKESNVFTIISCHNEDEIQFAKENKVDAITYSPIFYKELKGKPKGLDNLKYIVDKYQTKDFSIIALGGITSLLNIEEVIRTNANGFAAIRYFKMEPFPSSL